LSDTTTVVRSRIVGTGRYLPEKVLTNVDISKFVDTSDEWITARTGIRERRVMPEGMVTSDMVVAAGRAACEAAGIEPGDLDCIVVATTTADVTMPSCAVMAQEKLGSRCPAFDVAAACAGFSHGLVVADSLVRTGVYKKLLFVGAEALSRFMNWEDRGTCILFGDGAGAVVMVPDEQTVPVTSKEARGVLSTHLGSDGTQWRELNILGGGTMHGATEQTVADKLHTLRMNGRVIFSQAVRHLSSSCLEVMKTAELSPDDVDLVLPHQANLRIIDAVAKRLKLPKDKFIVNIAKYGNTSAASIPIALDEAVRGGRVNEGSTIVMCGLGAGLVWGAAAVRW